MLADAWFDCVIELLLETAALVDLVTARDDDPVPEVVPA